MPTLLVHMKIREDSIARFETILRELVEETRKHEPNCLRYEYWRATSVGQYYAFLSFPDPLAFYEHQASVYHEQYIGELGVMFESFKIEYVDPIVAGGSNLPRSTAYPLSKEAPELLRKQETLYPIETQSWWPPVE